MQKIKDFESFAAGYFSALRIKHPTANDIRNYCIESRTFAAALSFYACNDPYVMAQQSSDAKFEAVAKNIRKLPRD